MKRIISPRSLFFVLLGVGGATLAAGLVGALTGCATRPPLALVPEVDLQRYSGAWFEVARLPNWFQRSCTGVTTARYTPLSNGKIEVLNRCEGSDGGVREILGTASVVPGSGNARLKVSFGGPIRGDYWIIGLDQKDYSWAVVGHPSRRYLWFLARSEVISKSDFETMKSIARSQGFDLSKLRIHPQE